MPAMDAETEEIVRLGKEVYERDIRAKVEADNHGKMLVLDVDSGDYAIADNSLKALNMLKAKRPGARAFLVRVGYPTAIKFGGGRKARRS